MWRQASTSMKPYWPPWRSGSGISIRLFSIRTFIRWTWAGSTVTASGRSATMKALGTSPRLISPHLKTRRNPPLEAARLDFFDRLSFEQLEQLYRRADRNDVDDLLALPAANDSARRGQEPVYRNSVLYGRTDGVHPGTDPHS